MADHIPMYKIRIWHKNVSDLSLTTVVSDPRVFGYKISHRTWLSPALHSRLIETPVTRYGVGRRQEIKEDMFEKTGKAQKPSVNVVWNGEE